MKTYLYADRGPEAVPRLLRAERTVSRKGGWRLLVPRVPIWWYLCMLLVLFLFSGPLLRLVDPVAAAVDVGTLSLLFLGLLAGLAFVAVGRWLLGLLWPVFREFGQHHFEPIFKSLLPWQKIVIYLVCYFLLLFAFVACWVAVW